MPTPNTKELELHSEFDELTRLEPFVEELKSWTSLSENDFSRILLTLSEAVNNAIMHGNKQDPQKKVIIKSLWQNEQQILTISVEDEGEGFDPEAIPDPLQEENLLSEGGRGVYLIKQYADEVTFSNTGSTITMSFELDE